jgi:predicted ATP-dependent serine protease
MGGLSAKLMFPAKMRAAIGIGGLTAAITGSFLPTILLGYAGYRLGKTEELTEVDKQVISNKIKAIKSRIAQLESGVRAAEGNETGIMNSWDLQNYQYDMYPFTGEFEALMGKPSIPFACMVYGKPKNGKSIFSIQFAKYLSENFGSVLYVAAEEGFSYTLQKKLTEFGMHNKNLHFGNYREIGPLREALNGQKFDFVFLDSVNYMNLTPEQIEELKAENPETSFITINQATKNGSARGSLVMEHNCDIIIEVIQGVAYHRGRFQDAGTQFVIFGDKEGEEVQEVKGVNEEQLSLF